MDETKPAQRIGDYEFLDLLAVGGMGRLWRVRHVKLGAIYVAKELRADLRGDPEFVQRFLHEAQLVANFHHPNVVQVFGYDAGEGVVVETQSAAVSGARFQGGTP